MAETKTKNTTNAECKKITVRLPRLEGRDAIQEEFFSHNGKNYIIKRGETVEIPEAVAGIIRDSEQAEDYALRYSNDLKKSEEEKKF